jgi:ATP-dependent helicase/nuclease subunit A
LFPSRPDVEEPTPLSPAERGSGDAAARRGRLIHRLLEVLPDVAPDDRKAAAERFLARRALDLSVAQQNTLCADVLAILADPALAALFGPNSRAEVPLVGRWGDRFVSGQVDRLVVTDDAVLVIDYKSAVRPPSDTAAIPRAYRQQMAAYRAVLAQIYSSRTVRCALLWTAGPLLVALPDDFWQAEERSSGVGCLDAPPSRP